MKLIRIYIPILIIGILPIFSCEDFLEEETFSQLTPDIVFSSPANAELAVNGIYNQLFATRDLFQVYYWAVGIRIDGEVTTGAPDVWVDNTFNSDDAILTRYWSSFYNAINTANTAIDGISGMDVNESFTEDTKNRLLGESRLLRAVCYFYLVRHFGGVPVLTEPTQNPEATIIPRASVTEVFDQIIEDLEFAKVHLPINYNGGFPDSGRMTKGAATATLAKVYATMSGVRFEPILGQTYWDEAKAELDEMVDVSNPSQSKSPYMYSLLPDWKNQYPGTTGGAPWGYLREPDERGQEVILGSAYNTAISYGWFNYAHSRAFGISPYVAEKFPVGDYRAEITFDSTDFATKGYLYTAKIGKSAGGAFGNRGAFYETRYTEVLLLMSEVENEINNGPTQLALDCINAVRERARGGNGGLESRTIPVDIAPGLTHDQFKEVVFDERVVEFFQEGKFYFDLQRSGRQERDWQDLGAGALGDRPAWNEKFRFRPLPQTEILRTGGVIEQNTGY